MTSTSAPHFSISDKAFDRDLSVDENLRRLRDAGFSRLHLATKWTKPEPFTTEEEDAWQAALADKDIRVQDVHGCHPKDTHLWSEPESAREHAVRLFRHRLQLTHRFGGDAMVYHVPWKAPVTPREIEALLEELRKAEDIARELGVTIALENHYLAENDRRTLSAAFEAFPADYIGFTFDPGHALISGNSEWLMANCAERLHILHLNDNDTNADHHWNPFDPEGHADWDAIASFLKRSPYQKALQLEVSWTPERHGPHQSFLAAARQAVETLHVRVSSQK